MSRPLHELPTIETLISLADPHDPLLWVRGERGCVGIGEVARLTFTGADRFADAAAAWSAIHTRATVDDAVQAPGSGLIAFGTFAFDDASAAQSVLIIPRLIVMRHMDIAWITEISTSPIESSVFETSAVETSAIDQAPNMPAAVARGQWLGADLPTATPDPAYSAGVRQATRELKAGHAEKIVMSRRVVASIDANDDVRVPLSRLAVRYLDCWTFAVDGLIGASPETLIRRTEGVVSARVLAGTRARGATPEADEQARADLLADPKEQHEHDFAVQSVITALGPYVAELDCDDRPFALQLPNVWHLATDLRATPTRSGTSLDLAGALHPTAAVAGTPTQTAIAAISRLEGFDRERYAGAVGWIDADGDGEWVIALRCAQLGEYPWASAAADAPVTTPARRSLTAYAGGGILPGSVPEREFQETVSKFRPIREAFAAEGFDTEE